MRGAILGVITDPELAADAHAAGLGGSFHAVFNRAERTKFSEPFEAPATVLCLHHGVAVGRRGQLAGCRFDLGPTAALQIGGVTVVVITHRHQCHEPMFFEMCGIDIAAARTVALKSRGHFRAGFDEFFADAQILLTRTPTTRPARFEFHRLRDR